MKIAIKKLCLTGVTLALCFAGLSLAGAAEPPAFLPEFAGGVQDNAVWQDTNLFSVADQCSTQYKCGLLSDQPVKMKLCQAQVKTCVANYMIKQGASKQAIAFAGYNEIPSVIDQIKRYAKLDVVYAKMQMADANGGFFIITKKGFIVPAFNAIKNVDKNPSFRALKKQYPRALLWNNPNSTDWPAVNIINGAEQVVFKYPVKDGCNACAIVAYADVAYNFDREGKYLGTKLIKLIPIKASD